jgi:Mg2+ and Co2+ transporter CorA
LTLEDILQQDPREKLELFPKLGYYLIVFRAIESRTTRERFQPQDSSRTGRDYGDEGIVGDTNVYLVVFRGGICSVRFLYPFLLQAYSPGAYSSISLISPVRLGDSFMVFFAQA